MDHQKVAIKLISEYFDIIVGPQPTVEWLKAEKCALKHARAIQKEKKQFSNELADWQKVEQEILKP